jgi:hypothetical protein
VKQPYSYAAIGHDGAILGVEDDVDSAVELAQAMDPGTIVQRQAADEYEPNAAGDIPSREMPLLALDSCGIRPIHSRASTMTLKAAHEALFPFFKGIKKRGAVSGRYESATGMAQSWIGQNYKTSKASPADEDPSKVMGLTLVPAAHPRQAAKGVGPYEFLREPERQPDGLKMIGRWKNEFDSRRQPKFSSFCIGSSKNCRDSCLVFAGNNAAEVYNTYRKLAQTMALLNEPEAFARMLVEAIDRFVRSKTIRIVGATPYMRLNVLSDIPWELVTPWIFDVFPKLMFYDYTKVPGRNVGSGSHRQYDLTFSVSGENFEYAHQEIHEHRRRVAVVILGHRRRGRGGKWTPIKERGKKLVDAVPLPREFWGLPVVDGDITDVRPRDPEPCCVALRWKTPSGKRSGIYVDPTSPEYSFVTPVYVVGGASIYDRPNPNSDDQWLIVPQTPRQTDSTYDVPLDD